MKIQIRIVVKHQPARHLLKISPILHVSKERMKTKAEIDMSAAAIARRLDEVRSLFRLAMSLSQARIVGTIEPAKQR